MSDSREANMSSTPRPPLDPAKLTPAQLEALNIAKAQGKKLSLTKDEILGHFDHDAVDELIEAISTNKRESAIPRNRS